MKLYNLNFPNNNLYVILSKQPSLFDLPLSLPLLYHKSLNPCFHSTHRRKTTSSSGRDWTAFLKQLDVFWGAGKTKENAKMF